jgi:hypothetical protein
MGTPAGPPRTSLDKITRCRECDNALPRFTAEGKEAVIARAAPDMLAALKAAEEELRLLRMKDTKAVYNPGLRAIISLAIAKAEGRA